MSATREYRNAGAIEDAAASIGAAIVVTEHLLSALSSVLPDDFPTGDVEQALARVRDAQEELSAALGV